jgi:predicted amidophosphoribosyltransferase
MVRGPSLKLLDTLPHIRCPGCEVQMDREKLHYYCPKCGYTFDVDSEKKLPVFPDTELDDDEFQRRYQVMEQFHSMRWSARRG